jgi:dolichol kinase
MALRLENIRSARALLNQSLSAFLDEKDRENAILTNIYLLVGSSLPLWIYPFHEILILSSRIFALGVGDTAASVGGTLWGRNKIPGTSKSIEGTICSIVAQTAMATLLISFS